MDNKVDLEPDDDMAMDPRNAPEVTQTQPYVPTETHPPLPKPQDHNQHWKGHGSSWGQWGEDEWSGHGAWEESTTIFRNRGNGRNYTNYSKVQKQGEDPQ